MKRLSYIEDAWCQKLSIWNLFLSFVIICFLLFSSCRFNNTYLPKRNVLCAETYLQHKFCEIFKTSITSFINAGQSKIYFNTLRTGDADLRFYITTVQDGWRKCGFLTRACFPCTIHLIMQYIEPVSEWSCWRIFIETWPHSELNFRHGASSI